VIAAVVFDMPRQQPFSYAVPPGMSLQPGQRVSAPLHGRSRIGVVVALRDGEMAGLKPIERPVESVPVLSAAALELGRWTAGESLSSWGSTLLAFLPPVAGRGGDVVAAPREPRPGLASRAELWIGAAREARLVEDLQRGAGSALVIAADREGAAQWAARLDATRLDSGAPDSVRRAAWFAAARGRARITVGTRSALLTPLPPPATLVLLDEHDAAHKPPGPPRIHSRDLLRQRAMLEGGSRLLMLSATPSVESWWRAETQQAIRDDPDDASWPEIITADTRGILRNHPLTLPLTRGIEEVTRHGRRALLLVTRRASALICPECGGLLRCRDCGVPLGFFREAKTLGCRLCAKTEPLPDHCSQCGGHRLFPFGWDAERVEAAVSKRFPKLTVSRVDPRAQVVVGTPAMLRRFAAGRLGCVGIVALDGLLSMPDFRGGERAFQLTWAAAEAAGPNGRLVIQTLHPEHYAVQAVKDRDRRSFYEQELQLRAELGYPPFRRICVVSVRAKGESEARARLAACAEALRGVTGLTVYPPAPIGPSATQTGRWRFVIKGPGELPRLVGPALAPFLERGRRAGAVVEVEMDPVS
jgi:primosomal protein N' (replication factor Y)